MSINETRKVNRKEFLALGGLGALAAGGLLGKAGLGVGQARAAIPVAATVNATGPRIRLVATDGHISLPGRDPLFVMGFVEGDPNASIASLTQDFKGRVQVPAPIISVDKDDELLIVLTNVGFIARPDLDDSHTIHWHGFRNPLALFDGVPEVSIAVPVYRDFPYVYKPHDEGTYMYHCHFEDSEHVQMGMTGVVFVNPAQGANFAYDDGDGSTAFARQFALLLNEIDPRPHDGLEKIQEFVWSDYKGQYWIINGRTYPDTVELGGADSPAHLEFQPVSSLMQVNPGERVLMRLVNLGYEQHAMQLVGIPMKVVGEDATFLRGQDGTDLTYTAHTIYIGPGEARDVLFTAPAFDASADVYADGVGSYNRYLFANRSSYKLTTPGVPGLGGHVTEVRVYAGSPLPVQSEPNETYASV